MPYILDHHECGRNRLGDLARVSDDDRLGGLAALGAEGLNGLDHLKALRDISEHNVLAVEPVGLDGAEEELRAVRVGAGVSHGQNSGASVLELEVLVRELLSVDRLSAGAVSAGEVTALKTKVKMREAGMCWQERSGAGQR